MQHKKVLVTGGSGLVGNAIQKVIAHEKPENEVWIFLSSKDGDLSCLNDAELIFIRNKPTHVIHLAAMVGGLFHNMSNNLTFLRKNLAINDNVLACCHKHNVIKVVSCLSTCIFPDKTTYPINETMVHNGPPHPSNYGYSHAKRLIDVLNHGYADQFGRRYTSVIPCNIYGPNDNFDLQTSHVIPALIRKVYDAIDSGQSSWTVLGSGRPLRQFIYSEDLAKLMVWVLRSYDEIDPIILSVDEADEVSIAEVAKFVAEAAGYSSPILFDTSAADGQIKKTASNTKLRTYLPEFNFTPLQQGIRTTVEWYRDNMCTATF